MLLLNKDEIKKVFSMHDAIEADKECYKAFSEGKFDVPLRAVINGSEGNFLFMPAYSEEMKAAGLKIVNFDTRINDKSLVDAFVGGDDEAGAYKAGKFICEQLGVPIEHLAYEEAAVDSYNNRVAEYSDQNTGCIDQDISGLS